MIKRQKLQIKIFMIALGALLILLPFAGCAKPAPAPAPTPAPVWTRASDNQIWLASLYSSHP